jgi:hypothetical protein
MDARSKVIMVRARQERRRHGWRNVQWGDGKRIRVDGGSRFRCSLVVENEMSRDEL